MAIQTLHDTGPSYPIKSKMDGAVYAVSTPDCVCKGVGDEFTINYVSDSLDISFRAGSQAVIGGSFFKLTGDESVRLSANSTIYLCASVDVSKPAGTIGSFEQRTSSNIATGNINSSDTTRDLLLYVITTSGNGVSQVQDRRVVRGDTLSVGGYTIAVMSQTEYDALATKDPNTLYHIYEV